MLPSRPGPSSHGKRKMGEPPSGEEIQRKQRRKGKQRALEPSASSSEMRFTNLAQTVDNRETVWYPDDRDISQPLLFRNRSMGTVLLRKLWHRLQHDPNFVQRWTRSETPVELSITCNDALQQRLYIAQGVALLVVVDLCTPPNYNQSSPNAAAGICIPAIGLFGKDHSGKLFYALRQDEFSNLVGKVRSQIARVQSLAHSRGQVRPVVQQQNTHGRSNLPPHPNQQKISHSYASPHGPFTMQTTTQVHTQNTFTFPSSIASNPYAPHLAYAHRPQPSQPKGPIDQQSTWVFPTGLNNSQAGPSAWRSHTPSTSNQSLPDQGNSGDNRGLFHTMEVNQNNTFTFGNQNMGWGSSSFAAQWNIHTGSTTPFQIPPEQGSSSQQLLQHPRSDATGFVAPTFGNMLAPGTAHSQDQISGHDIFHAASAVAPTQSSEPTSHLTNQHLSQPGTPAIDSYEMQPIQLPQILHFNFSISNPPHAQIQPNSFQASPMPAFWPTESQQGVAQPSSNAFSGDSIETPFQQNAQQLDFSDYSYGEGGDTFELEVQPDAYTAAIPSSSTGADEAQQEASCNIEYEGTMKPPLLNATELLVRLHASQAVEKSQSVDQQPRAVPANNLVSGDTMELSQNNRQVQALLAVILDVNNDKGETPQPVNLEPSECDPTDSSYASWMNWGSP